MSATKSINVTDLETLSIAVNLSSISESGGNATGTVTRSNTDNGSDLVVNLLSSDTSEAVLPATITIPANQSAIDFVITAVDDALLDGAQAVVVTGSASGYVGGVKTINVTDAETLTVSINVTSISELGGTVVGTVTRSNTDIGNSLVVTLTSDDVTEAKVPTSVVIPANQASVSFTITAADDTLLDGSQVVTITGSATGYTSVSQSITVTDVENLTLSFAAISISEQGGTTSGTITRGNTDIGSALIVNLSSSDSSEATVPATVTIPANQSSVTFTFSAADDTLFDGAQTVTVTASSPGYLNAVKDLIITDFETLTLSIDVNSISEFDGTATGTVTRNNTDLGTTVVVSLSTNDASEASVPATVTIPANQVSVSFTISAVDDALLDGTQVAAITSSANGYQSHSTNLSITDLETISLSINLPSISERGGVATGSVLRSNSDFGSPLIVSLSSSDPTEVTVPATVTIPANQASVSFGITAVDDVLLDGTQSIVITSSAAQYVGASQSIEVSDYETLSVDVSTGSISELNGVATGTVTRNNSDISTALVVNLTSSDATEATVPATVTIPPNQSSITFTITSVDDTLLDGLQSVVIKGSAAGYLDSSKTIAVTDHETLSLTLSVNSISERGGTTTGTVSRSNTDNGSTLVVNLSSSDPTEAIVPASVTIPANQSLVSFSITSVDDSVLDGTQTVIITSSTITGYSGSSQSLSVTDHETLSVNITSTSISERGGSASGTVRRSNSDIGSPLIVTLTSSDTTELTVPTTVTIPANQTLATFSITAVDDSLLDGSQIISITGSAAGFVDGSKSIDVTDLEELLLTIDQNAISEQLGTATGTVTRGNTDIGSALLVNLTISDSLAASIPASVTIPANESKITFSITSVDDTLLDGSQLLTIQASAAGYVGASKSLTVTDHETLSISLSAPSMSERGGIIQGVVTRNNSDISAALGVTLNSSDPSEATVPVSITIPANQSSVEFSITAVDDTLADGTQSVTINGSAFAYIDVVTTISVTDLETLTLTLGASSISERDGTATATLSRGNTDIGSPLTVTLTSSDTTELLVPASITIPANQASTTFTYTGVDDSLLDGQQSVLITSSAIGYADSTKPVNVLDHESLIIEIDSASISETNDSANATVRRTNTDIGSSLVVLVTSNDETEVTVPVSVEIPPGQAAVSFVIAGRDDQATDGSQLVVISVGGDGYMTGDVKITVTDSSFPWHNATLPQDVDANGMVAPVDALLVINTLNARGARPLNTGRGKPFYDVNSDGSVSPLDALLVINYLNSKAIPAGEGEQRGSSNRPATEVDEAVLELLAADHIANAASFDTLSENGISKYRRSRGIR